MLKKLLFVAGLALAVPSQAALIVNGDFETGDLSGWTTFTFDIAPSTGGFAGTPSVVSFDTDGDGVVSQAASFQVGQISGQIGGGDPRVGGGISQMLTLATGILSVSADIAAFSEGNNADGGLFELLLNGIVLDSHDFGSIGPFYEGTIERSVLSFTTAVAAGSHELSIRMARGYGVSSSSPIEYIDDVVANQVPEPTTAALVMLGLVGVANLRRNRNSLRN